MAASPYLHFIGKLNVPRGVLWWGMLDNSYTALYLRTKTGGMVSY